MLEQGSTKAPSPLHASPDPYHSPFFACEVYGSWGVVMPERGSTKAPSQLHASPDPYL